MQKILCVCLMVFLAVALSAESATPEVSMNRIAERYVKLVLQIGQYSPDMVDSYSGPVEWKTEAERNKKELLPYEELRSEAAELLKLLNTLKTAGGSGIELQRWKYLKCQIAALAANIELLHGKKMSFDEESRAVYACQAPVHSEEYFNELLKKIDVLLPGKGDLQKRLFNYREQFIIPKDKVPAVFDAAIAECRKRSLAFVTLPAGESFKTEFVTGKPWSAYNWYKGNAFSLIQVNMDMPQYIHVPLQLAAHEGYPGHHVYNALLEELLLKGKKWIEFSVYALFSPQSLVAEGTAEAAAKLIFTPEEKLAFMEKVLFPLAGLNPARAKEYDEIIALTEKLDYAMTEVARRLLDGKRSEAEAVKWLMTFALVVLVAQVAQYIVASGGKRVRPVLLMLMSHALGVSNARIQAQRINLAAVVEFIHTATLLHDDVVDDSQLRRGRPTANNT
ncbi:MAG TPA: polyprenyl synthetase family protein, partial [Candidatus Ozemobacteraceae bacterium]|nr:polyprenyl synthetase family protein [Candidatus Ozemobacteraceae bacterium]